jgi:hypothetical protein
METIARHEAVQGVGGEVIKKSRFAVTLGLVLAVAFAAVAYGDGATDNVAQVEGSVKPSKLDKKKYKPVNLFSGVATQTNVTGTQANPASEYISYPKDVKFNFKAGDVCTALPPSGSTPDQAKSACPPSSYLGSGHASVQFPGLALIDDVTVSVFRGPTSKGIQLHTYSPTLLAASPTVQGQIVKSNAGSKFGYALSVPNSPVTGSGMITEFNATITKKSKAVLARCKSKKFVFQRKVTYTDGSSETAELTQKCKQKKS